MIGVGTGMFLINPFLYQSASAFTNDYSLLFDGVDEYVDCGQPTIFDGATNWTISYWVKFASSGFYCPVGYRPAGAGTTFIQQIYQHTGSRVDFKIGSAYQRTAASSILTNTWYHFVQVYDGTQGVNADRLKVYIDGVLASVTTSGTFPTSMDTMSGGVSDRVLNIGKYNGGVYETNGYIDEVAIFDYSLNATQVSDLYNSGTPTDLSVAAGGAPEHWWRCGDGDTFPTLTDNGDTGGFDGTMTNMESGDITTDVPV